MKTKKLLVECADDRKDILWSAFTHFGLMEDSHSSFRVVVDGKEHYFMFDDEVNKNFMEMGQWLPQR
jgi:hypothetical protein